MGYTIKKVNGIIRLFKGSALKNIPNTIPEIINIGIAQTSFLFKSSIILQILFIFFSLSN
jgi:hypothetical protein